MVREYKRYDEYKDSGIKIIGNIPRGWNLNKIKYNNIINPNKSELSYKEIDVSFIPMEYIKDGFIENKDIKNIDEVYNGYAYFKEGDILLAKVTPCFENGNLGIAKNLKNGIGFGTTEVHVIRAKKDNKKFIYYLFQNKHFKEKGNSEMYGAGGLKRISSDFVENYIYPRPDYQTQICISNYLDKKTAEINEIINKKETLIEQLEKYKKSVITEAVTKGKLGDKYINEDGKLVDEIEMKDSGVEWIGEIPEYSDVIPFKRISIITSAKRIHEKDYRDKGIPFYRSKEVARLSKRLKAEARNYISKELFNKIKNRYGIPEKGDILITSIGTIGQVWVCDGRDFYYKDGNITQIILESNNYINSKFIKYCFDSNLIKKQYKKMSAGSTLQALTIEKIKELIIIQSNKKIKTNIVNYLDNKIQQISNLINKTKESIEKYKEYKKSLIFEAVTGKIDLRDYKLEGGEEIAEHNNTNETERECLSAVD